MTMPAPHIVVLGSINLDLVVRCQHLPVPGETILATSCTEVNGGKGANQAVAAARAGGRISMIAAIGDDAYGDRLCAGLLSEGIDCSQVQHLESCQTGMAVVAVDDAGENSIIVIPGANARVDNIMLQNAEALIATADLLLVQLEVPHATVAAAIRMAKQHGIKVMLDPAPAPAGQTLFAELFEVDVLCPNQSEAEALLNRPVRTIEQALDAAKEFVTSKNVTHAIITLGADGIVYASNETTLTLPAFACMAVDSTAAGDAFAGAFAVCWMQTGEIEQALRFASAAGAIAASTAGAQPSLPTAEQIHQFLTLQAASHD